MTILETTYPGYLHGLYRYTNHTIGDKCSFTDLVIVICIKTDSPGERREIISIDRHQLWTWTHRIMVKSICLKRSCTILLNIDYYVLLGLRNTIARLLVAQTMLTIWIKSFSAPLTGRGR